MKTQRIEIGLDVDEVTIVRTTSEPQAAPVKTQQPQQRNGGKQGPRKQGPRKQGQNESDADHTARVERYEKKHSTAAPQQPTASLSTREASDKPKPKGFTTTLCKCRGDKQKSKRQGTYGQPDYVAAVYESTTDFSAFGIPSLEVPAGQALCGTFRKNDGKTFDAAVYHTGHGVRNGDWMQLLFYDEANGEAKGGSGRPLFKTNADIVELFLMPCQCENCKAS